MRTVTVTANSSSAARLGCGVAASAAAREIVRPIRRGWAKVDCDEGCILGSRRDQRCIGDGSSRHAGAPESGRLRTQDYVLAGGMTDGDVVHVVDDDEAVRSSLAFLLGAAGLQVAVHATAEAFLCAAEASSVGCVLTDVRMPGLGGLELQARLLARGWQVPVVVITGHGDVPTAVQALKDGALDFLEKPFDDEQLLDAVQRALAAGRALRTSQATTEAAARRLATLTPREREVLDGLVAGHASKQIAQDLGASPRTIEVHRLRVMEKLQVRNLPELVRLVLAASPDRPA